MKRLVIYPYKFGSKGGKVMRDWLPAVRVRDIGRYRRRINDLIINWGNTNAPSFGESDLNKYEAVARACNKVEALTTMREAGVRTVEFTLDKEEAQRWVDEGHTVYARTLTRANSGRGIVIVSGDDELPNAPLYSKGIVSDIEYRVHVFRGVAIDYTKKIPLESSNLTIAESKIKSHSRGWTFARNVETRPSVQEEAIKAVNALGLDFGAVDIIINPNNKNRPHVLEVNTSPGLEAGSRTFNSYKEAIYKYVESFE
jgi:hypothetical protein